MQLYFHMQWYCTIIIIDNITYNYIYIYKNIIDHVNLSCPEAMDADPAAEAEAEADLEAEADVGDPEAVEAEEAEAPGAPGWSWDALAWYPWSP